MNFDFCKQFDAVITAFFCVGYRPIYNNKDMVLGKLFSNFPESLLTRFPGQICAENKHGRISDLTALLIGGTNQYTEVGHHSQHLI